VTGWEDLCHATEHLGGSMTVDRRYQSDVDAIVSHRHDLGDDYWTTPDRRLAKRHRIGIRFPQIPPSWLG
jgi:hypothetical protein